MLRRISYGDSRAMNDWLNERRRSGQSEEPRRVVSDIVAAIRNGGDRALLDFTRRFDGVELAASRLRIDKADIEAAGRSAAGTESLSRVADRIRRFHELERPEDRRLSLGSGGSIEQRRIPIDAVGVYVPGGGAPYASSLLMSAIPARVAGVKRIAVATPPHPDGSVHPLILAAAFVCGIDEVYAVGGAQGIAALAFGTETIPRVSKVVGPGNAYVNEAKRILFGEVGIDTLAGPSEVAILADASASPAFIAADLLAQAEHDPESLCVLVSPSTNLIDCVEAEIERRLPTLARQDVIRSSLANGCAVETNSLDDAVDWIERIAPEHVEILTDQPESVAGRIRTAGVVLCGPFAPAAVCDYGIGPNHVLPTGGAARFASALGVDDFLRRVSVLSPSRESFLSVCQDCIRLAEAEDLTAHAEALRARMGGSDGR